MQEQTKLEYLISGNFDAKYGREILRSRYSPVGNSVYKKVCGIVNKDVNEGYINCGINRR